jgi:hypothetical protein
MRKLALTLVPLLVVACDRGPTTPPATITPAFGATAANEFTYAWPERITWLDNQRPAAWDVYLLGYDPADDYTCNGGVNVGGIPVREHLLVTQEDFPPGSQRDQALITIIGRAPLYMYRRADFLPPSATDAEWCEWLKEGWIAAGTWTATLQIDNDLNGFDGTPGVNSWGGAETGLLTGKDGTLYRYAWKYRGLCNPDWPDLCRITHEEDGVQRIGQ